MGPSNLLFTVEPLIVISKRYIQTAEVKYVLPLRFNSSIVMVIWQSFLTHLQNVETFFKKSINRMV